jgi:hypothetical protein
LTYYLRFDSLQIRAEVAILFVYGLCGLFK